MRKNATTLVTFIMLLLAVIVLSFLMVEPFVPYIIFGGILAILVYPVYLALRRVGRGPKFSAFLVTAGIFILVAGPFSFFATRALDQGVTFSQKFAEGDVFDLAGAAHWLQTHPRLQVIFGVPATLETRVQEAVRGAAKTLSSRFLDEVSTLPSIVLRSVIALITCFFFLTDGRRFLDWFADKVPLDEDVRAHLINAFKSTSVSVIWATLAGALVQSLIILSGFLALGMPAAFFAAGAAFLSAWIPLVGTSPVWLAGCLYLFTIHSYAKIFILIVIGLFTGIADNIVRPIVLKGRSDMHPVVSLVAIFGGIRMFGLLGVFYGPIIASVLIALLQVWPLVGSRFGLSFGLKRPDVET